MEKYLHQRFLLNTTENWLWFFGVLFFGFLLKTLISTLLSKLIYRFLKRESAGVSINEFVSLIRKPLEFLIILIIIYLALDELKISSKLRIIPLQNIRFSILIHRALDTFFIVSITWLITRVIRFIALIFKAKAKETASRLDDQLVPFFRDIAITLTIFISFFVILGFVFKQDVASLITGLGIGGVALALAARETLENLFASFTLVLDSPFVVGDDVEIGIITGTVEYVGFRSTRIRTSDGSLVTMPNRLMVSQALNNLTERKHRRVKHFLKLEPSTTIAQIQTLCEEIKHSLGLHPFTSIEKPMVQFDTFNDYSNDLLVVYYISTPDWRLFNETKEEVNFSIKEILEKHNIVLAIPKSKII